MRNEEGRKLRDSKYILEEDQVSVVGEEGIKGKVKFSTRVLNVGTTW